MYTTDHNSNMQSLCRILRCVVFIYAQWRTLSGLFFPSLCLLLCHVYHITVGEGHRWGDVEADVYAVGQSALLKLMQGCYCWDLFGKPSWKHTYQQNGELWSLFISDWSPGSIKFSGCTLSCIACQCQQSPLSPCISKGIRSSILSSC